MVKTPRRVRSRYMTDPQGRVWLCVDRLRLESVGRWSGAHYGWRMLGALEVSA